MNERERERERERESVLLIHGERQTDSSREIIGSQEYFHALIVI